MVFDIELTAVAPETALATRGAAHGDTATGGCAGAEPLPLLGSLECDSLPTRPNSLLQASVEDIAVGAILLQSTLSSTETAALAQHSLAQLATGSPSMLILLYPSPPSFAGGPDVDACLHNLAAFCRPETPKDGSCETRSACPRSCSAKRLVL